MNRTAGVSGQYGRLTAIAGGLLIVITGIIATGIRAAPVTVTALSMDQQARHASARVLPYANPQAPKGGTLSMMRLGTFDSFNALINKGTAVAGTAYLSDTLSAASLDEPFVRYPLLAERFTLDWDNPSWIIYHLNPRARFSNGQPVTADDVVFTFETLLKDGTPGLRTYFGDIASVTALSPQQVRFDLKTRENRELLLTVGEVGIMSRQDWRNRRFNQVSLVPYLGSGPYLVERIDPGRSISYRRNPDYWGRDLMINRGRYNFDRIRYQYYRDGDVAFNAFKSGQYQFREENKARNWAKNYNFPAVQQGMVQRQIIRLGTPQPMQAMIMNQRRSLFQDIRVRKALTLAYDFEWLNKALFVGQYERLNSFFQNSELAATGRPDATEMALIRPLLPLIPAEQHQDILRDQRLPVSDGSGFNRANLLKARSLLLQAGYRYQNGQLVDRQGKPVTIDFLLPDMTLQRTVLPYSQNLARLGIRCNIRVADVPQYIERTRRFDYDMIIDQFPQSLSPGNEQIGYWTSAAANDPGAHNSAGIRQPAIDRLVSQLTAAPNRQALITHARVLDRLLRAGYYVIPQYTATGERLAHWQQYRHPQQLPRYDIGLDYWWSDPVAQQRVSQYLRR